MNKENEKKWFIYMMDHHEGPFNLQELRDMKDSKTISAESFSWSEGMVDWLPIAQVKDLHDLLFKAPEAKKPTPKVEKKQDEPISKSKPSGIKTIAWLCTISIGLLFSSLVLMSRFAGEDLHSQLRPVLAAITQSIPAIGPIFHLIPSLNDINAEELPELEAARMEPLESGTKIAIALSVNDPNRPFFYLSTNLPDPIKFEVFLVGNPETLLNRLQYTSQTTLTTQHGFGKSEVFLADGGQPIPKGEYQVYVVESNDQDEPVRRALNRTLEFRASIKTPKLIPDHTRFLVSKTYFLGGEKDETYLTRLKSFHEKVKQNAEHEVLELKQYTDTLSLQFNTLTTEFRKILRFRHPTDDAKANWKRSVDTWIQINTQLDQTIQTWSDETLQNEFFYGKVYGLVKGAYTSIKELFQLESTYIESPRNRETFEIEHGKATGEARESLEILRKKMDIVLKSPKTQSGLPTREGL